MLRSSPKDRHEGEAHDERSTEGRRLALAEGSSLALALAHAAEVAPMIRVADVVKILDEAETPGQAPDERTRLIERAPAALLDLGTSPAEIVRAFADRLDVEISIDDEAPAAAHVLDAGEREALVDDVAGALGVKLSFVEATARPDDPR